MADGADRCPMGGARAPDRGLPAARQGAAAPPAPDDRRDPVAACQRRQVACGPGRIRAVVDGGADLHPLVSSWRVGAAAGPGPGARRQARHDLPRRHQRPRPPEGGRRCGQGGDRTRRGAGEALGRSRGGYGTKAVVVADGSGRAVAFRVAPGQAHELPHAVPLLDRLPGVPRWIVADRGYASHAFRDHVWGQGARPAIPAKGNEAPVACPAWVYTNRNRVERLWSRLKEWRAVATRYEKTARSFLGVLCLAATMDWLRR